MTVKADRFCTLCRLSQTSKQVCMLGSGPKKSDIAIITPLPSISNDLINLLQNAGLEDIYHLSSVACWTPNRKQPTKNQISKCNHWVEAQLQDIEAKYVILVGNAGLMSITGRAGISRQRGRPFEQDGRIYLPINDPAAAVYNHTLLKVIERDLDFFNEVVEFGGIPKSRELNIRVVRSNKDLKEMLVDLIGVCSYDIETTCLYPWQEAKDDNPAADITSIGFGTEKYQWIIQRDRFSLKKAFKKINQHIRRMGNRLRLVMHNGKFDCLWGLVHYGVDWINWFDTMLAHYLLDENDRHSLKYLSMKYCGAPDWEIDLDTKKGAGDLDKQAEYHAHDLFYTLALYKVLVNMFKPEPRVEQVFDHILMPCARNFVHIEYEGVCVDINRFSEVERILRKDFDDALKALQRWQPTEDFNWGSPKQLGKLLFEDLGLNVIERTKTGAPSCSESVIKRIIHPCTDDLLKYRKAKQQLSFFIDGWKPWLTYKDGQWYLHPSFKLHGTVTGRLSCENPNLQQVPRDPRIRSLIISPPGWTLIECDLSQIELRIAAELAKEPTMLNAFKTGQDPHWITAIKAIGDSGAYTEMVKKTGKKLGGKGGYRKSIELVFNAGPSKCAELVQDWAKLEVRKKAKAINFGYLYGMWWKKFIIYARDTYNVKVNEEEARESRESFFNTYSRFPDWHERQARTARRDGYVESLSGRKRRLPEAKHAKNKWVRKEAERKAINSPVQSFANELNLMSLIQLMEEYDRDIVRPCGTVHDSILLRVRNNYLAEVYYRLLKIMEWPDLMDTLKINISVPLEAEAKVGPWGRGVPLERYDRV